MKVYILIAMRKNVNNELIQKEAVKICHILKLGNQDKLLFMRVDVVIPGKSSSHVIKAIMNNSLQVKGILFTISYILIEG